MKKASGDSSFCLRCLPLLKATTSAINSLLRGSIVVSWMKNEADKEELVFLLLPAPIAEEASTFRSWSW